MNILIKHLKDFLNLFFFLMKSYKINNFLLSTGTSNKPGKTSIIVLKIN
jgi:hypothetical protein